jgi:aryl carrier-like protein
VPAKLPLIVAGWGAVTAWPVDRPLGTDGESLIGAQQDASRAVRVTADGPVVLMVVRDVLERPSISLSDDFFTAGGDSLLAMHVVGRLSRARGLPVRVLHLFAHPVLREFTTVTMRFELDAMPRALVAEVGQVYASVGPRRGSA